MYTCLCVYTYIAKYINTAIKEEKLIHSTQFQFFLKFCGRPSKSLDEAKYITVRQNTTSASEKQA